MVRSCSRGFCLSKYMLALMIVVSPFVISSVIVSSSESCVISVASTFLLVIITAALLRASPAVYILYCVSIPAALPWRIYGSCMHIITTLLSAVFFIRLAVATLEFCRLICWHFSSSFVSSMILSVWVLVVSVVRFSFILFCDSQHTGLFPVQ